MLTAGFAGRTLVRMGERLLSRMPIVRSVYATLKQILEAMLAQKSRSFREVGWSSTRGAAWAPRRRHRADPW